MDQQRILDLVDEAIAPDQLSQASALEWLEDLISDLESRADALRDDLRRSEG